MKIAIIGAGTSGLYLSWKLSEKGHKVTIFERKKEIGNEVCSGLFSQRILDFIPQSSELIQNELNCAFIHFPKKTIKLQFSKKFFVINHYKLDKLLAYLAEKTGVNIVLSNNISELPKGYDRIIGCDGANSFVRNNLKLSNPKFRLGSQGFVVKKSDLNYFEVWPCKNGFIWKIPKKTEIEYGIMADIKSARNLFKDFSEKNNLALDNIKSKVIPQGLIIPKNPLITLCGDSTGLTKPWSGGGVIWQLSSADILLENFPDFLKYRKKVKKLFKFKIILYKVIIKIVYFLGFNFPYFLPKTIKMESDFLIFKK